MGQFKFTVHTLSSAFNDLSRGVLNLVGSDDLQRKSSNYSRNIATIVSCFSIGSWGNIRCRGPSVPIAKDKATADLVGPRPPSSP